MEAIEGTRKFSQAQNKGDHGPFAHGGIKP
jgi:hypothetical protein